MLRRGQAGPTALIASILFITVALLVAPCGTAPAYAQTAAPVIETAELRLWPEYDDPGLLVILAGQFAAGTNFPMQAAFPAPPGIRNVQATYQDSSATLISRPFEIKDGQLTYELPAAGFQVEYYVDRTPSDEQRNITYAFVAPYAISALRVAVQQPARSAAFTLTPASETSQKAADGLNYYVFNRRNIAAGEKLDITISYSKSDTGLSAPPLAVAPTPTRDDFATALPAFDAATTSAPAAAASTGWLPWLLIGAGALLLAGIVVYWLLAQRRQVDARTVSTVRPAEVRPGRSASPPRSTGPARSTGQGVAFCTSCGNALNGDDRFCSQCGAPRRS